MRFILYVGLFCIGALGKAEESDVSREDPTAGNALTDVNKAGNEVRSNIAELILAAQKLKGVKDTASKSTVESLKSLFPEANIKIGGNTILTRQADTSPEQETTSPTTTLAPTTTTENTASLPKTGDVELMMPDIVHSGHMLHWSSSQQYLAISDIWGQQYLRYQERTDTTNNTETDRDARQEEGSGDGETTEQPEPTTTTEPLPYILKTLSIPAETVFLLRPQDKTEGAYPLLVPVTDYYNYTQDQDEVILAFNERIHMASWDMEADNM